MAGSVIRSSDGISTRTLQRMAGMSEGEINLRSLLSDLQRNHHGPAHIAHRIKRLSVAQRNTLRDAYQHGTLSAAWGETLLSACSDYLEWRIH
jgi:hypothetical protein